METQACLSVERQNADKRTNSEHTPEIPNDGQPTKKPKDRVASQTIVFCRSRNYGSVSAAAAAAAAAGASSPSPLYLM
jgi:hypothetical protein